MGGLGSRARGKSDRAIFDHAARATKVSPTELVHVGDGARGAGWNATRRVLDRDNGHADYQAAPRIRRLTELIDWV